MKLECVKEKIQDAVSRAEKITGKNISLPVLKCILLDAQKDCLYIKSTNLDLGIEIKISAKVDKEGVVAVPGSTLSSFLNNIGNEKSVILEEKDGNLTVATSKTSTIIKTLPSDDYPSIPKVESSNILQLPSEDFLSGLKSVWYSSATSSIKPELSSVRVYPEDDNLIFVATDGFRLAEKVIKIRKPIDFTHILIPVKNVGEIIRVFEGLDEDLNIYIDKNQIGISSEHIYLVSRTVEGSFPDYRNIIPKEKTTEVIVLKQDVQNSLKITSIFTDSFNHVRFSVFPGKKEFSLGTKNNDVGENSTKLSATLTGEDLEVNFNYRYISDSFGSIDSDSISFHFNGINKPLIIKGSNDKTFLYLVMPMNR